MFKRKNYYLHLLQLAKNYRKRRIKVTVPPIRLWIELSSDCNLACVMCPNKDLPDSDRGFMHWDTFQKVIDESGSYIHEAALHHRGESLLHPELGRFLAYAARKLPLTKLHTNGTLLNSTIREEILSSGLKKLSVSFDGFDRKDYETIRRGADFEQTLSNIRALAGEKKQKGQRYPRIVMEFIEVKPEKSKKRSEFLKTLKEGGVEKIIFKQPHNWAGSIRGRFSKKQYAPCTFLWNAMVILYNGDVSPCTQDFFGKYIMGNIHQNTLLEIWNSKPMQDYRKHLADGKYQQYCTCGECDRLWRKTFLGIPAEYLKNIVTRRMP